MKTNKETKDLISEWKKTRLFFGICLLLLLFATPVMLPTVSHADFEQFGQVYEVLEEGTMYKSDDCFIYIPNDCSEKTVCDVYFAGGCGGWVLRQDLAVNYLKNYKPDGIFIWYKNSGIYDRVNRVSRTADLLNQLHSATGVDTGTVSITSSSNGGYTALYAASHLESEYGIETDKVVILDMGNVWAKSEFLVSNDEAQEMVKMGTTVYQFGRNGETFTMKGAQQFASYGVRLVEVACKGEGHDQISSDAFRFGVFSWAIDDSNVPLYDDWYTEARVNF